MCVPVEKRTLRGGKHDLIYSYFEKESLCKKYVNDSNFLRFMGTIRDIKVTPEGKKEKFIKFVETIREGYVDRWDEWAVQLAELSLSSFFSLMLENNLFPDGTASEDKWSVTYTQLLYHLGMMSIDVLDTK